MATKGFPSSGMSARPLRHNQLPSALEPVTRWTYRHLGHLFQPTFEQWEIEFLRHIHPGREIAAWAKMTWAVLEFTRHHPFYEKRAIANIVLRMGDGYEPECLTAETERELRRLLANSPAEMSNPAGNFYST